MKTLLLTALLAFTIAQAKMIMVCTPGEGCTPVFIYGDDDE